MVITSQMFQVIGCKHPHYVYINTEHMYGKTYENWRCNKCAHKETILVVGDNNAGEEQTEDSENTYARSRRQQLGEWLVEPYLAAKGHVREQQAGEGLGDRANLEQRPLVGGLAGIERSEALLPRLRPVDDADAHGADCIRLHGLAAERLDFRLQALQAFAIRPRGKVGCIRAAVNAADCQRQHENEVPPRSSGMPGCVHGGWISAADEGLNDWTVGTRGSPSVSAQKLSSGRWRRPCCTRSASCWAWTWTTGGRVSSVNETPMNPEVLPALSVAWNWTVWGPSAGRPPPARWGSGTTRWPGRTRRRPAGRSPPRPGRSGPSGSPRPRSRRSPARRP